MTRALATGRPGVGAIRFPEGIKEFGREMAFTSTGQLYRNDGLDSGGAPTNSWTPYGSEFRCNVAPVPAATGAGTETAGQINESSTHVVRTDTGLNVSLSDRVLVDGVLYEITASVQQSGEMAEYLEVRNAIGASV